MEEEGTLVPSGDMYRLYFKGLVSEETSQLLAGFGVAICDQDDKLLFQMKGPIHGSDITVLEAELTALKRGLTATVKLGLDHISICCDHNHIYELVMGRSVPEQDNIAMLMNDVQRMRQQLSSSNPILVTRDQISFAYKLAMETVASDISIRMPATCSICFNDDLEAEQMYSVPLCGHQFCVECVRRHIEVRLLEGSVPTCLHYQCESKLTLRSCDNLLTPKLKAIWEQRIEEELIPVPDRVYCPKPTCAGLMSKTELSTSTEEDEGSRSCCVKCGEPFCINCKVPWHSNLSCDDYKRLGLNPTTNDEKLKVLANQKMWRQCEKCKHMIELSKGCIHVTCRCGYSFCYTCGAEWNEKGCPHQKKLDADICRFVTTCVSILVLLTISIVGVIIFLILHYGKK
ncbi:potential E3 ubiquitin-protein ligase ariadne-2 [Arabidopsis lyrata subsp. lyrata]|uniref:potential E3 ubiquitin-protein ligase ariadne-2 n=1 Tax=Arabidopsis lyrata subsp. lyrata TaxID=81972 RepID=UPI000A29B037|nr:potential E3 ubiquitin-protein ligase ariadne-2 [Arabidopsis lyrata subsp. lyrata]|eukprot:XP_002875622.2 potential E3 ubiquitin-protein ligase ariadne-2 [Arabidopsis lyrata subsp. lyrata]